MTGLQEGMMLVDLKVTLQVKIGLLQSRRVNMSCDFRPPAPLLDPAVPCPSLCSTRPSSLLAT